MKSPYFPSLLLLLTLAQNEFEYSLSERRIAQEEWHQFRFGGMPMASDPNQWTFAGMPGMPEMQEVSMPAQVIQASDSPQKGSTLETNIQDVEVGKDKLVLVNDQGTIKMLRASQLPTVNKQNTEVTTQTPSTVIQMPLEQYLTKDSNTNPTKNPNPIEIIHQNYDSGHRMTGLPVAYATSSNQPDRPNVIYQNMGNNPCLKASDNPPIYIPAPQVSASTSRSSGNRKMVRIIIEMPESMTRNIDEASQYAATQVQRLKVSDESGATGATGAKPRRKKKKNVHEIIRKVVQTEEDDDEPEEEPTHVLEGSAEDMVDEASNQNNGNPNVIYTKTTEENDNNGGQKYIIVRKNGRIRGKNNRQENNLKAIDKYKKIIKVYRD